jgi:hypothetical protein
MEPRQFIPFWLAVIATLTLGGCGGGLAGIAAGGAEIIARGVTSTIDTNGGIAGVPLGVINYTPEQNAQRAANNAAVPPRSDKNTTTVYQGGGVTPGGYPQPSYGGGYPVGYGGGYGPSYPPYYGRGW